MQDSLRERRRLRARKYYEQNREAIIARASKWYRENVDAVLARSKQYYRKNREAVMARNKLWREQNREAHRALVKEYRKQNPEWEFRSRLKRKYGLSLEDYQQLLVQQGRKCAACRNEFGTGPDTPHVDHCHKTGRVRGVLCRNCNHALGNVRDDPARLAGLIAYLTVKEGH